MSATNAGILIVSYNSSAFLDPCLQAALLNSENVVVVDNASEDDSCAVILRYSRARLIANPKNVGFAAAVNQGITALDVEYVLLLNPDAVLKTSLEALIAACSRDNTAAAGGKLIDAEGELQTGFCVRRFPTAMTLAFEALGLNRLWRSNLVNRRYRCLDLDLTRPQAVDQPAGAFLMIRRSVWAKLGGFDESFFPVWFEEVDFLKRARNAGYVIRYTPDAVATHHGAHSIRWLPKAASRWYWYDNLIRFSAKHFHSIGFRMVCAAVLAGVSARAVMGMLSGPVARKARGCSAVLRLAVTLLIRGPGGRTNGETARQTKLSNSHSHGL